MLKHSRTKLLLRLNVFIGCPDNSKKKKRVTPNDLVTAFGKFCREDFRGRSECRKPPEITSSRTTNENAVIAVRRIASLALARKLLHLPIPQPQARRTTRCHSRGEKDTNFTKPSEARRFVSNTNWTVTNFRANLQVYKSHHHRSLNRYYHILLSSDLNTSQHYHHSRPVSAHHEIKSKQNEKTKTGSGHLLRALAVGPSPLRLRSVLVLRVTPTVGSLLDQQLNHSLVSIRCSRLECVAIIAALGIDVGAIFEQ
jgi:hypothetical protein